jgi:glycerol-3-phosphate dehydrogenase
MSATRAELQRTIETTSYDVCVIGGGATGAGCALDAQLRGLRTVLIEADDFASRTSSASTKMAHGGVRYLQAAVTKLDSRQFDLVRHALHERALMLRNAPHLAHPLEFVVPCFGRIEQLYYGIGMKMYDWVAGHASIGPSRVLSRAETLRHLPGVQRERLVGAATYVDGQFDDARYCIALVLTFTGVGGTALNHARAVGFERRGGKITAAIVEDEFTRDTFRVRAGAFVNATGPYSDAVRRLASVDAPPRLQPSKGVHILFPMPEDWGDRALLVPKTEDGRVIFALPYNGRLLVGTTDTEADPSTDLTITREEIDYLLRQINPYLARPFAASQIVSGFAGLRPLVRSGDSHNTATLIRDDEVEADPASGLISILGGKWTTYRAMAEKTVDRIRPGGCVTATTPLAGSDGSTPGDLLRLGADSPDLMEPLVAGAAVTRAQVVYAARHEMAVTVEDVLARRVGLELYDWRMAMAAAPVVADLLSRELGSEVTAKEYIARLQGRAATAGIALG